MKGNRYRALSLILAVLMLLSVLTLTSCNRKYDEEEVLEAAKKLLKEAEVLNEIYYGSGIEYFDSEEEIGYYRKANPMHLEELGFSTIDELKKKTEQTFSAKYSETVYSTILSSMTDGDGIVSLARYYQAYDEETNQPTHIMVYSKFSLMLKSDIEYDYSTLTVVGSKKEKVEVTVEATLTNSEGQTQRTTISIMLVEEENGWRINNPTYANYNAYMDRYNELQDKDLKK